MAILMRYGWASEASPPTTIAASARSTCRQYGRRYCSSRRISRASYALPRTSSSCMVAAGQAGSSLSSLPRLPDQHFLPLLRLYSCGHHTGEAMGDKSDILQGTLDLMVLQTLE